MSDSNYIPPQVWQWTGEKTDLNQPTSGARYEHALPVGKHPLQLYSLATPNGQKSHYFIRRAFSSRTPRC